MHNYVDFTFFIQYKVYKNQTEYMSSCMYSGMYVSQRKGLL